MNRKVGIIGCGHISDTHIKSWQKARYSSLYGLFDVNTSLAKSKSKRYGISRVFETVEDIIRECDVLDICTPPSTHHLLTIKVIAAGKHLLIEKPIVTDIAHWQEIKSILLTSRSKLAVLHNLKFTKAVLAGKKIIDSGKIGVVLRINRYFLTHPKHDRMLIGDTHWSHKLPGGRWFETMPHELYLTHYYSGASTLESITILQTPQMLPGAPADEVCITMKNDRCITNFHYSSNCEQNKRYIEVVGTTGTLVIDILSDMVFVDKVKETKQKRAVGIMMLEAYKRVWQAIPDRIRYFSEKMRGISPHSRIILQFDRYIHGIDVSPTPLEEVDYVVTYCDLIGKSINEKLKATV